VPIPIASGERLFTRWDFRPLIEKQAVAFVQPDPCHSGLSECRRVAAMAETYFIGVVPHNPNGPVSTAACVQFAASIANFVILETYPDDVPDIRQRILAEPLALDGDAYRLPEGPGLGVAVDEEALNALQVTATGHHGRRPRRLWSLTSA
jgi:galactonate dehydratase